MPNGPENPQQVIPERRSNFSQRANAFTAWGSSIASIGIETKYPRLTKIGILVGLLGMRMNYNNSERARRETQAKIDTLDTLSETPEKTTIIKASSDFINGHREELIKSIGLNIVGGALFAHGSLNISLKYMGLGSILFICGSGILYSSLKMADKNIDNANAYIQSNTRYD